MCCMRGFPFHSQLLWSEHIFSRSNPRGGPLQFLPLKYIQTHWRIRGLFRIFSCLFMQGKVLSVNDSLGDAVLHSLDSFSSLFQWPERIFLIFCQVYSCIGFYFISVCVCGGAVHMCIHTHMHMWNPLYLVFNKSIILLKIKVYLVFANIGAYLQYFVSVCPSKWFYFIVNVLLNVFASFCTYQSIPPLYNYIYFSACILSCA